MENFPARGLKFDENGLNIERPGLEGSMLLRDRADVSVSLRKGARVSQRQNRWSGHLRGAIALALVATLTPLPLAAAESESSPKPGPIRASVAKITASDAAAMPPARRSESRGATQSTQGQDRSFFKTGPGILALVVMIAGTGYAIYSTRNDRIKSPGKE